MVPCGREVAINPVQETTVAGNGFIDVFHI
jgi:hypothetical protein